MTNKKGYTEMNDDELTNVVGGAAYGANNVLYNVSVYTYNYYYLDGNLYQCIGFTDNGYGNQTPVFDELRPNDGVTVRSCITLDSLDGIRVTDPPLWAKSRD